MTVLLPALGQTSANYFPDTSCLTFLNFIKLSPTEEAWPGLSRK